MYRKTNQVRPALKRLSLFFVVISMAMVATGQDHVSAKVVSVLDGNTLEVVVDKDGENYRLMFAGIDCPELGQAYGEQAKVFSEKLLLGKTVSIVWTGKDRLGMRLAMVYLQQRDVRFELVREGLAWTAERNAEAELEQAKESARLEQKGLWADDAAIAPWIFRRQQTMLVPKTS
jgi:endonuclease YncB( thermonuclease family)